MKPITRSLRAFRKSSLVLVLCCLFSCQQTKQSAPELSDNKSSTQQSPIEKARQVLVHYWDTVALTDSMVATHPEVGEQVFADYVLLLRNVPPEVAQEGLRQFVDKLVPSDKVFLFYKGLFDKYLYDPNSPYRQEELYEAFLQAVIDQPQLGDLYKIGPRELISLVRRNKPGTLATDFSYTLSNGNTKRLYGLTTEFVLVYFNNPDCHECAVVTEKLQASPRIRKYLTAGRLSLLSLYTDEDLAAYWSTLDSRPGNWINAYDDKAVVKNQSLYDLKAIPALYLLDKEKKVLLKDVTFEALEQYLMVMENKQYL
ncbi:MAG: hypothetical protein BWY72_00805 [Bacteroidetes bacterium ADurb.Bin416]|nr:MAG: hypothetical protein BWY72_00805 [Bacteroidetes bacterium ADurb.Bin416]